MASSKYPQASVDSIAEYASGSHNRSPDPTPPPPPPPADTTIGTVTVAGSDTGKVGESGVYSVSVDGDATALSYKWSAVGGTIRGSGTAVNATIDWNTDGDGVVTCTVTSADPNATDSPQSGEIEVTISTLFKLTSIGSLSFGGPQNPTTGDDVSYTCNNDGDAGGLSYDWAVTGGTIKGSKTNKKVDLTCGPAGTMQLMCQVTSSDPNCSDTPQQKQSNIPVAMPPAEIGKVTVSGMAQTFVGDEEQYTCTFDGNIKSPIYRWRLAGVGGEIIVGGGLNDDTVTVRAQSPGGYDVICEVDADDYYVAERNVLGKIGVQVLTKVEDPPEDE